MLRIKEFKEYNLSRLVVELREERHKGKRASATVTGCQTGKTGSTHFFGGAVSCGDGYRGA